MRTMIAAVIMTGIICIISACKTSETPMAKGNIGGDWTISEISGKKIVTPADAQAAFIKIDAKKKQVNAITCLPLNSNQQKLYEKLEKI